MRPASEIAAEVWDSMQRGYNVIDRYAAAIERDRLEAIAACREEAEAGVCSFGTDYDVRCAHTACAIKRVIGRRIRSLAAPSPETGTAAVPIEPPPPWAGCTLCAEQWKEPIEKCVRSYHAAHPIVVTVAGPAPEPVKPPAMCPTALVSD